METEYNNIAIKENKTTHKYDLYSTDVPNLYLGSVEKLADNLWYYFPDPRYISLEELTEIADFIKQLNCKSGGEK